MAPESQQHSSSSKPEVNEQRVLKLRQALDLLDADGTESVDVRELKVLLRAFGFAPPKEELISTISEIDKQGKGKIHFSEFLNVITQKMSDENTKEEILRPLQSFDNDESGMILLTTLLKCMADATGETLQKMTGKEDQEGDGEVSQ